MTTAIEVTGLSRHFGDVRAVDNVSFTVTAEGRVENIGILTSEPGDEFDDAATEAVAQWRFEPPLENGVPVDRRVAVRLAFDLE